jgi:hypothetical protein
MPKHCRFNEAHPDPSQLTPSFWNNILTPVKS